MIFVTCGSISTVLRCAAHALAVGKPITIVSRKSGKPYGYPFGIDRDAVWQTNTPLPLSVVHLEDYARGTWWMAYRGIQHEEIRTQLGNRKRDAIEYQSHSDSSGMSAVTRL